MTIAKPQTAKQPNNKRTNYKPRHDKKAEILNKLKKLRKLKKTEKTKKTKKIEIWKEIWKKFKASRCNFLSFTFSFLEFFTPVSIFIHFPKFNRGMRKCQIFLFSYFRTFLRLQKS